MIASDKLSQVLPHTHTHPDNILLTTVSVAVAPGKAAMAALRAMATEDSFMMIVGDIFASRCWYY